MSVSSILNIRAYLSEYLLLDIYLLIGGAKGLELHVATGPG